MLLRFFISQCIALSFIGQACGEDEVLILPDGSLESQSDEYLALLQTQFTVGQAPVRPDSPGQFIVKPIQFKPLIYRNQTAASDLIPTMYMCAGEVFPCALTEEWNNIGLMCAFAFAALVYAYMPDGSSQDEVVRDGRWDLAKYFFMACVVWSHVLGHWYIQSDYKGFPQEFVSRFHMPGFSFISGMFAASGPLVELRDGGKVTVSFPKLRSVMRDLILVNLTMRPLSFILSAMNHGFDSTVTRHRLNFFNVSIEWWYLGALAMWQLVTPMLCTVRFPLLAAGAVSLVFHGTTELGPGFYFFFFVLGFVLGGGGKDGEERKRMRQNVESWLCKKEMRLAAALILFFWSFVLGYILYGKIQPHAGSPWWQHTLALIFDPNTDFTRELTPWELGGMATDVSRIAVTTVVTTSFLVLCFAMPKCEVLSAAGTRTLYAYVLQRDVLLENSHLQYFVIRNVPASFRPMVCGCLAFLFTLLLASKLTQKLTHHFVQPQWLIDLIALKAPTKLRNLESAPDGIAKEPQAAGEALLKSVDK